MADRIINLGSDHRIIVDDTANTAKLQFYDSSAGAWQDVMAYDTANQKITMDPTVNKSTPAVTLEGTETNAKTLSLRENAGVTEIYDEGAGSVVLTIESHQSRHASGGADEITGIAAAQLSAGTIKTVVPIPIPDSNQSGLAADSTGVKWTSDFVQNLDPQNIGSATIRASWTASNTDSTTAIEVYDETAGSVLGSVSGNTGTDAEGAVSGFTAGNAVVVRANVTTASATSGATTSVVYAVLEVTYSVS